MTAPFKKLLAVAALVLSTLISVRAWADTNYDFTFTDTMWGSGTNVTGTFTVDASNVVKSLTGYVTAPDVVHGAITLLPPDTIYSNTNQLYPSGPYYVSEPGIGFSNGSTNYYLFNAFARGGGDPNYYLDQWTADKGSNTVGGGSMTLTASGGAPEIDGSLAPKIGLLLGCSYLMFGRKKQNSEPMMTA